MLPQWWLQFDQRFLQSRAAAFAGRVGQSRALTPFLAGLEGRLSEMLERTGWLERFLVRGAPHDRSLSFAYESTASPEFQFLSLEEELDDMSEEAALDWLRRVAPAHPVVRRLQKVARENRARAAAAPARKSTSSTAPSASRPAARRGSKGAAAAVVGVATPNRANVPGVENVPARENVPGLENVPARANVPSQANVNVPGLETEPALDALQAGTREPVFQIEAASEAVDRRPFGPGDLPASSESVTEGRAIGGRDVAEVRSIPSLSLDDIAGVPGAEQLSVVLRSLLGPAAEEVEAGVTPRGLLRALVSMRRDQGVGAPVPGSRGAAAFGTSEAERVWVAAGDEAEAPFEAAVSAARGTGPSRPRRAAPSAADVRFSQTLTMAPALRSLAGLPPRGRAASSAGDVVAAGGSTGRARSLQQPVSDSLHQPVGDSLQQPVTGSTAERARRADPALLGDADLGAGSARRSAAKAEERLASEASRAAVADGARGETRVRPQALRRMLGGTVLSTLSTSSLLRSLLADEGGQAGDLFDGALFQQGPSRLVAGNLMSSTAERFSPISYAQAREVVSPAEEARSAANDARFPGADASDRVLLEASEGSSDASVSPQSAATASRGAKRARGASPSMAAARSTAATAAPAAAAREGSRATRSSRALGGTSNAVPMPALVASLRQALEARSSMSANVEAFSHLAEVIAEGRARSVTRSADATASSTDVTTAPASPRAESAPTADSAARAPEARSARVRAAERRAASAKGMPIGFGSVLRSQGGLNAGEASEKADGDATQASRPAGSARSTVRLSGLTLDERGVPVMGRGTRTRAMAPLSDALAMLAVGESESGEASTPSLASSGRVAERRAVEAVRAAIVAFEKRLAASGPKAGASEATSEATERHEVVTVPARLTARETKGSAATKGAPAPVGSDSKAPVGSESRGFVTLAPDAAGWASLASLARAATGAESNAPAALEAFAATLGARLGTVDVSPRSLRAAVEAAWRTSQNEAFAAPTPGVSAALATPALAGASRALAFGDRVLSFSMPDVTAATRDYAPSRAAGTAYEAVGAAGELTFLEARDAESADVAARPSPAATVAARVRLASALRAAADSSPSTLAPQASRRTSDLAARVSSGRALSASEARAVVSALQAAGVQVPAEAARALRATGGTLAATPSVASNALARAESWQSLPTLRAATATAPEGAARRSDRSSTVGVPSVTGGAGTESLHFTVAERGGDAAARMGGNLATWLEAPHPDLAEAGGSSAAQVVPGLAGRTQALAGWTPQGLSATSVASASEALRPGAYPEAEIGEWLRLEGIESEPESSVPSPGASRRGRSGARRGAERSVASSVHGRAVAATAPAPRAARTVLAEGGRALTSLGPNLSRWLSPSSSPRAAQPSFARAGGDAGNAERRSSYGTVSGVGEWLRLDVEGGSSEYASETGAKRTVRAKSSEGRLQVAAPLTGVAAERLALPMTERLERGGRAMSGAALLTEAMGGASSASHLDVGRLGGNVLDLVVLAGEQSSGEAGVASVDTARGPAATSSRGMPRAQSAEAIRGHQRPGARPLQGAHSAGFVPLDAPRVAGLQARVGGWLQEVYGVPAMSGALNRGRALEGFASLLLGGGTAAEAARAFSLLEGGSALTFLEMAGEGSSPAIPSGSATRGPAVRAGTNQPLGKRPEGGVGATVAGVSRTGGATAPMGAPGGYAGQASADMGAFVETPSAFRNEASAFFAQTAEPGQTASSSVGPAAALGMPLVNPVVNVVSQAASFSMAGGQQAGGASVREEVTTSVERVSKGREDSEDELRKVLPELVEMLRRRMRTERERRGLM